MEWECMGVKKVPAHIWAAIAIILVGLALTVMTRDWQPREVVESPQGGTHA
jgi:hypothetical protein